EVAVADLATAGAAHRARLADRVGREVVVEEEGLPVLLDEPVDALLVLAGAERRRDDRLRLAAREERRAVRAREEAHLDADRADRLEVAAVHAAPIVEDL